ncbi:MAG: helix-turn-helix domain-containing protein [Sphingobacteriales bacterium]|uniref:helix-turn-helix domain-containing protein n=1 Tax=Hydrotalea flava TaxID=714549 RepID=UPI0008344A29|nr:helix-turn-helix domain-containing protein [Hydrotalea flava]RTL48079.1 MAG: helix-turn-helix domain-containing protein [Sphingobacteriales bacterium]
MGKINKIETVAQFNRDRGQKTLHPLVSVLDNAHSKPVQEARYISELYIVFLKDVICGELKYGRNHYDYEEGTLLLIAPGQVFGFEERGKMVQPSGWSLVFHPDLIRGTHLGKHINEYDFFSYDSNEALHVSDSERAIVVECFRKIQYELAHAIDKHSRTLIVSNIELFLNYCVRFYDRQFVTREHINKDVLTGFESLLNEYFQSDKPQILGLPSVTYCAEQLNLSPKYFGDLIKKEAGKTAQEFIQLKLIDTAKEKIFDTKKSISEVAYDLGFKYPAHFSRMFKKRVGYSPNEYRLLN